MIDPQMTQSKSKPSSLNRNMTFWLKFFYVGVTDGVFSEDARRVFIINFFATVGILFTFPLGFFSLYNDEITRGIVLLSIALLYVINHVYLRYTHNYVVSGNLVIYPLYALMIYLIYTGGFNGTGHVWIFCVPAVSLFLHGMKQGLIELCVFTLVLTFVMFFVDNDFSESGYHSALKSRILFSFLVVIFLSAIYEYSMNRFNRELKEASAKLKLVAYIDSLTELLNRRGMFQRLEKDTQIKYHLLLADVDFFKRINDDYGHDVGDYALRKLAVIIQSTLSDNALAARWGGEEFLIALPESSEQGAYDLAELIRQRVENYEFFYLDQKFRMTLSFGVASMSNTTSLREAITLADHRLYTAKRFGRNQISKS